MPPELPLDIILLAQAVGSLGMFGAIWVIQAAHYPLQRTSRSRFVTFEASHMRRISYVVGPLMLIEAAAAVWLLFMELPGRARNWRGSGWAGAAAVALDLILQVPCHWILERGWDAKAHHRLVMTNWLRTVAWTGRAVIAVWMLML